MKIAVIIPAYNAERYVSDCLESLQAQTHKDWVAYVMDDGSRDGTAAAIEVFAARDPRIRLWRQENRGLVPTMNTLMDKVGDEEALAFLDIDDFIHPQMFELLVSALERNRSDVAECRIRHVAENAHPDVFGTLTDVPERTLDDLSVYWLKRTAPSGWINKQNKLYRRSAIAGIRFQSTLSYEDDYFFACEVNAVLRRKTLVDAELYAYRENPHSATSSIPFARYVQATCERIRLTDEVFIKSGRVPVALLAEYRKDLAKDAYRMCIRKNLKKNRDPRQRRELFDYAGHFFRRLAQERGFSVAGLNPIQRLIFRSCVRRSYVLARLLVALT